MPVTDATPTPLAAVYCRVSTEDQSRGYSLPTQREACLQYAAEHGYQVPAPWCIEEDGSGATLERPGLQRVRELVRTKAVDAVIVYDLDRLARNLGHQLYVMEEAERVGVTLHCVTQPITPGAAGHLLFQMQGAFAEYERAKIRERTQRGSVGRAQAGHPGGGRVPFGYTYRSEPHAGAWVTDAEAAAVVRQMFAWCLEGMTTRAIARRLTEAGTVRPTARSREPTDQPPTPWSQQTVYAILANPTYTGTAHWGKHQNLSPTRHQRRPQEEWVPFACPVLIEPETFARAQQAMATRKHTSRRNRKHEYLLSGKRLRCGRCGRHMMQVIRAGKGWYRCGSRLVYAGVGPRCQGSAKIATIDAYVWEQVERVLRDPDRLLSIAEQQQGHAREHEEQAREGIAQAEAALRELDGQATRWAEAYALQMISMTQLKGYHNDIVQRKAHLHADLERWRVTLADTVWQREVLNELIPTIKHVWEVMTYPLVPDDRAEAPCMQEVSEDDKRFFVDLFDVKASWKPGENPTVTINLTPGMEAVPDVTSAVARCCIPCTWRERKSWEYRRR